MRRCFIALDLPTTTQSALAGALQQLTSLAHRDHVVAHAVRPVPAANLHLTLKFLGDTTDEELDTLHAALGDVARGHPPVIGAHLRGVGTFGPRRRPRVVFAPATRGDARTRLILLANEVGAVCDERGIGEEYNNSSRGRRPFSPHITLTRIADDERPLPRNVRRWIESMNSRNWGSLDGSELVMYESTQGHSGSEYTALWRLPLVGEP